MGQVSWKPAQKLMRNLQGSQAFSKTHVHFRLHDVRPSKTSAFI